MYELHSLPTVYRIPTTEDLVKHGFQDPQDMSVTHDSNQVFLPVGTTNLKNSPYSSAWFLDQ